MTKKKKDFDCVDFQRQRRLELSKHYNEDPDSFREDLKKATAQINEERKKRKEAA